MNVWKAPRVSALAAGTVALAALLAAAGANAQSSNPAGWYAGINGGRSDLKLRDGGLDAAFGDQGLTTSSSVDKHDEAYSLDFGFQFNPWLAVEGRYVDFGKFNFESAVAAPAPDTIDGRFKAHGFGVNAVGIVALPEGFAVFGKAGVFRSLKVGDSGSTGRADIDLVTAGITYRF